MAVCYIDSSALIKLVVREAETSALEAYFVESDGLLVSELAIVECGRAARRAAHARLLQAVDRVLEAVYLLGITQAIMERAAPHRRYSGRSIWFPCLAPHPHRCTPPGRRWFGWTRR